MYTQGKGLGCFPFACLLHSTKAMAKKCEPGVQHVHAFGSLRANVMYTIILPTCIVFMCTSQSIHNITCVHTHILGDPADCPLGTPGDYVTVTSLKTCMTLCIELYVQLHSVSFRDIYIAGILCVKVKTLLAGVKTTSCI